MQDNRGSDHDLITNPDDYRKFKICLRVKTAVCAVVGSVCVALVVVLTAAWMAGGMEQSQTRLPVAWGIAVGQLFIVPSIAVLTVDAFAHQFWTDD